MKQIHHFVVLSLLLLALPLSAQQIQPYAEPLVFGEDSLYHIVVQFNPELRPWFDDHGMPHFGIAPPSLALGAAIDDLGLRFVSHLPLSEFDLKALRMGIAPPPALNGFNIASLIGLAELKDSPKFSRQEAIEIGRKLLAFPQVHFVEIHPVTPPSPPSMDHEAPVVPPAANYEPQQDYIDSLNARYAWSKGIFGEGIQIVDIEFDWNQNHEEFAGRTFQKFDVIDASQQDHGTAVLGILYSKPDGSGTTGMVSEATIRGYAESEQVSSRPTQIAKAAQWLRPGDVMLLEMQYYTETNVCDYQGGNGYGPADYTPSVWNAVKAAVDAGIIVVAAGGNGGCNVDSYRTYQGDNGSIMVGASNRARAPMSFSAYGSRLNLFGWGDWVVVTTGYGDLSRGNGTNQTYTQKFSGTSSASPMVTSAVALLQAYAKTVYNVTLTPKEMKELLVATGKPQLSQTNRNIGKFPNIKAAFEELDKRYEVLSSSVELSSSSQEKESSSSIDVVVSSTIDDVSSSGTIDEISSSTTGNICEGKPLFEVGLDFSTLGYQAIYEGALWSCEALPMFCTVSEGQTPESRRWVLVGECDATSIGPIHQMARATMGWNHGLLSITTPQTGEWSLSLHDLQGRTVETRHLGYLEAGSISVKLTPPQAGLWFARLHGPQQAQLKIVSQ